MSILVALGTTLGFAMIDHWVIRSSRTMASRSVICTTAGNAGGARSSDSA
jgi:hypothetical protein